ncbi:hypothetical protein [Natronorubrum aibiense]|uniref:Uncharacterized protein n=1 Tax=Natronorubrum aibiense TaxID=348826 RepID=A0A5P9P5M7_9EURY|nr:hypothetical protein [Natronorubrum aibiense]QFU83376.1 hypothetical protein GCU68_12920 [Natronorubrum aibiense]
MKSFSEMLFDFGYFPLIHDSVKQDFLSWYYEGSKSSVVVKGLQMENSQLSDLAQDAQIEAENFDQNNQLSNLASIFEGWESRIKILFYYIAAGTILFGGGFSAIGVLQMKNTMFFAIAEIVGSLFFIGGTTFIIAYKIVVHQIKTNSDLIRRFNQELSEKPGDIRDNDQDWHRIAAQFFWNKSLLSPSTHICLIFLSVIRLLSTRLYGLIVADLREEVQEFVGMNSREILKQQAHRAMKGDIPAWPKSPKP